MLTASALLCVALLPTPRQDPPAPPPPAKPYKLGVRVEAEPRLPGLDGKEHALFTAHPEQVLVLVFWSYRDPVSRGYKAALAELAKTYAGKAAIYLVDSNHDELASAGDPLAKLRAVVAEEEITLPVLLDHGNVLADDFGAVANGQAFVLDSNRYLRYFGGIDDDPRGDRRGKGWEVRPWLANALEQLVGGEKPKEDWTRPAGRPIKRAPKGASADGAPK